MITETDQSKATEIVELGIRMGFISRGVKQWAVYVIAEAIANERERCAKEANYVAERFKEKSKTGFRCLQDDLLLMSASAQFVAAYLRDPIKNRLPD